MSNTESEKILSSCTFDKKKLKEEFSLISWDLFFDKLVFENFFNIIKNFKLCCGFIFIKDLSVYNVFVEVCTSCWFKGVYLWKNVTYVMKCNLGLNKF